ncbi:murein L,D-transpeptidase catalytic domain-containing protein [Aridibaculum aurantiacum]|uniref:murein L,D-transpeptidase catalytic domain-containing protein n=1 Tax=Aridibaculum aurantiacum TaxID=2810307 RepID=UPI001F61426E|nr:murein L,D-transpeptidase catalytic domain family protein [Aridibaculum aurantiacum]
MKWNAFLLFIAILFVGFLLYINKPASHIPTQKKKENLAPEETQAERLNNLAMQAADFCRKKKYNQDVCFLIDMRRPSGKKRFFIYDLKNRKIKDAGLVAHGSCNSLFLSEGKFSNVEGGGCSSLGRYKVGNRYNGNFGQAFKLHGLDSTNSNAFKRFVVLHAYHCVPDIEVYPAPICNSLGCPMISYKFLDVVNKEISRSSKPILLWIFK